MKIFELVPVAETSFGVNGAGSAGISSPSIYPGIIKEVSLNCCVNIS